MIKAPHHLAHKKNLTVDRRQVTGDTGHMTDDMFHVVNIVSKYQVTSSYGWRVKVF